MPGHVPNTSDIARRLLVTGIQDSGHETGSGDNFLTVRDEAAISASTSIIGLARLGYDTVDIVRRRPTAEIKDGGHGNRKWWPPS